MIPDYLIIEEELKRERARREESFQPIPLYVPTPPQHEWQDEVENDAPAEPERGVWIIDLDDYSTVRL